MNSIDIDVGGTFTDLVLNYENQTLIRKVPTTPYDLSVCFSNVIDEGARAIGMRMENLLPNIDMIRYSTTIALNRLLERKGPRLGLITTEGHEDTPFRHADAVAVGVDARQRLRDDACHHVEPIGQELLKLERRIVAAPGGLRLQVVMGRRAFHADSAHLLSCQARALAAACIPMHVPRRVVLKYDSR